MSEEGCETSLRCEIPSRLRRGLTRTGVLLSAVCVFLLFISSVPLMPVLARPKSAAQSVNGDYVSALATANRFLAAWQSQDRENGLVMLTEAAKQDTSEDQLDNFFSGGDGAAFEIGDGRKLKAGRYSFPVTLLEVKSFRRVHPRISQIVIVKIGKQEWAVDRLP